MSQEQKLRPIVFITVRGYGSVVLTPDECHTPETWAAIRKKLVATYVSECVVGPHRSPGGTCEGVGKAFQFFERHAEEWRCTFAEGDTVCNWLLVE